MSPLLPGALLALHVGGVRALTNGSKVIATAYRKEPVGGRLRLTRLGLPGDEHVYPQHGGPDKAVCVYPKKHYRYWQERLDLQLPEQVRQPRAPCYKIAARAHVRCGRRAVTSVATLRDRPQAPKLKPLLSTAVEPES